MSFFVLCSRSDGGDLRFENGKTAGSDAEKRHARLATELQAATVLFFQWSNPFQNAGCESIVFKK